MNWYRVRNLIQLSLKCRQERQTRKEIVCPGRGMTREREKGGENLKCGFCIVFILSDILFNRRHHDDCMYFGAGTKHWHEG